MLDDAYQDRCDIFVLVSGDSDLVPAVKKIRDRFLEKEVTVYVPLSYQIGGFTATVPRSSIKPIDMTVEQGMRFVVSAGILSGKNAKK